MWGALGSKTDVKDPWYGFHRFKQGYGGNLVEFLGTYDLVLESNMYSLYKTADNLRWKALRAKAKIRRFPGELFNWSRKTKVKATKAIDTVAKEFE